MKLFLSLQILIEKNFVATLKIILKKPCKFTGKTSKILENFFFCLEKWGPKCE